MLWNQKDLCFFNNKGHSLILWAEMEAETFTVALYGRYDPPLVEWRTQELKNTPTWTVRRTNPSLAPGETRFIEGAAGLSIKTWSLVQYRGQPPQETFLGTDYYRPLPNYIEYGP